MGLPIWTLPAPIDTAEATKADVTAAQRSPIRRRRSPARNALHRSNARRATAIRDEALTASGRATPGPGHTYRVPPPPRRSEEYNSRASGLWSNPPPPPIPASWDYSQASRDLTRAPSYYAASGLERDPGGYLYPRDAPRDRTEVRDAPDHAPRHRALRPLSVDGHPQHGAVAPDLQQLAPLRRWSRRNNVADGPLPASSLRESWEPSSAGSTPTPSNGLGDRERSISPARDDTTDAWDTMLTTVVPDAQLPSFDSSFTSAAASASASFSAGQSNNNSQSRSGSDTRSSSVSASSRRTHLTVPSPTLAPLHTAEPDCTTDDSGSDTDEDDSINLAVSEQLARTRHFSRPRSLPHASAEPHDTLRNRPWRTSAVRDSPAYQAEAELRRVTARHDAHRHLARSHTTSRPSSSQNLDSDISRLQQHGRELDRQMDELRNISADIDRRQFEREQRERDRESERRLGLPPMSPQRRGEMAEGSREDVSRFISHFESFRAARDAARRGLRHMTERRTRTEDELAEAMALSRRPGLGFGESEGWAHPPLLHPQPAEQDEGGEVLRDDRTVLRDELLGSDPELEGMRAILERLSQRRDIPDTWWRSAGLSTVIPRGRL